MENILNLTIVIPTVGEKSLLNVIENLNSTNSKPKKILVSIYKENFGKINNDIYLHDNVEIVQKYVIDGVKKKYYNVKDAEGNVLYEDVALFESAMGIVKHLMFGKTAHKVDEIAKLDERYAGYLTEAAMYKQKSLMITEDYKVDVFVAKQGNAIQKMANCKKQIKSLL